MDEAAGFLRPEMVSGGAADIEAALEVDIDDAVPVLLGHAVEDAVAQDAGIVDDDVDPAELIDRLLDDPVGAVPFGDAVAVHHGLAAGAADFVDDLEGRAAVLPFARDGAADIVDHHLRAMRGHHHREAATDSTARTRDNRNFSVQHLSVGHVDPLHFVSNSLP